MVKADIAGKPLERARQAKIGGASERGRATLAESRIAAATMSLSSPDCAS